METSPSRNSRCRGRSFQEEEQNVREDVERHAHQVVRELRIQNMSMNVRAAPKVAVDGERDREEPL